MLGDYERNELKRLYRAVHRGTDDGRRIGRFFVAERHRADRDPDIPTLLKEALDIEREVILELYAADVPNIVNR